MSDMPPGTSPNDEDPQTDPQADMQAEPEPEEVADDPAIELEETGRAEPIEGANQPPRVTFGDHVVAEIVRHARSDTSREIGGVLLGEVFGDEDQYVVVVDACIRAANTRAGRGNVTFTHETWEQINATMDEQYPDMEIVGWYHSHPDFGVFLSGYDTFIHENFFSAPWQIAYVIDPIREDRGCFVWHDDGIELLDDHFVHMVAYEGGEEMEEKKRDEKFTAASDAERPESPNTSGGSTKKGWFQGFLSVLVAIMLILQVYSLLLLRRVPGEIDDATSQIQSEVIEAAAPPPGVNPPPGQVADDEEEIDLGLGSVHLEPPIEEPVLQLHTVTPGETLQQISRQFYGTPDNENIIARLNGLPESVQLKPGMRLVLPQLPLRDADAKQTAEVEPTEPE